MADMKETLKSVTSTEAVIEVQIALDGKDPGPAQTETILARRKASPGGQSSWREGEEVVTLNGQKIRCSTLHWAGETYWYSDAIPGGLVRYEWKNDMGRVVTRIFVTGWEALR